MSARVAVSQSVLSWALQRSERTYEEALTKYPHLGDWMDGRIQPTLRDLEKFAVFTHTSLGALIMPEPPDETLPICVLVRVLLLNVPPGTFSTPSTVISSSRIGIMITLLNRGPRSFHSWAA